MSERFQFSNSEIELVCSYIKNDRAVANYFGISVDRVERVRAAMSRALYTWGTRGVSAEGGNSSSGVNSHLVAAIDAERGSRKLNDAIQSLFRKWEERHGFQYGAAEILLPAGYVPERQAA